jgi:hypothetical protein
MAEVVPVRRSFVGRAELVLARDHRFPLRDVPITPDPMTGLLRAIAEGRSDLGESVEVVVDLLAVNAGARRRWRHDVAEEARKKMGGSGRSGVSQLLWGDGGASSALFGSQVRGAVTPSLGQRRGGVVDSLLFGPGGGSSAGGAGRASRRVDSRSLEAIGERQELRMVAEKVIGTDPLFELQVLVRTESEIAGREAALLQNVIAGFEVWAGENYFRVAGVRVGPMFFGSDSVWRRRWFDRRWETGLHGGRKKQWVTATEIAGLLKPPTKHCSVQAVLRTGGVLPPPPKLPSYEVVDGMGPSDLLPLGIVSYDGVDKPVAVRLRETMFLYNSGRAAFGKTSSAISRFIGLARSGEGCMFLDPHADAVAKLKEFLGGEADRIWEINLGDSEAKLQAAWNPFSMEGLSRRHVEAKVSAVVDSFASALNWGEVNNRALTLTTMTAQALCELALVLPPELAPTIFQMSTMLSNEDWRLSVLSHVSAPVRDFFTDRFPKLAADAITPVTNLIDRIRASDTVAALLGSPKSTYDIRKAMDDGKIVLWSTAGTGAWSTLVTCFITYDLFRAAMSRSDVPMEKRRPFWAFIDELQRISGKGSGSAGESVARALEESRKMGLRLLLMSQRPGRLAQPTIDSILTNRSHLLSHIVDADSAKTLAREFGAGCDPNVFTSLPKYHFVAQVTHDDALSTPFLVRGFNPDELWADIRDVNTKPIDVAINKNLSRQPVRQTLRALANHDENIVAWLNSNRRTQVREDRDLGTNLSVLDDEVSRHGGAVVTPLRGPRR